MYKSPIEVTRLPIRLEPDPTRVITRRFCPGDETRIRGTIERILLISDEEVDEILDRLKQDFGRRHRDGIETLMEHYNSVRDLVPHADDLSDRRKVLIGAYFTMEYAIESAALFNPSMVPAVAQDDPSSGCTRFFMSLRATGEGHLSSIVFRQGIIDTACNIHVEPASPYTRVLKVVEDQRFDKETFFEKLIEMGGYTPLGGSVLERLADSFTFHELSQALEQTRAQLDAPATLQETTHNMMTLARSNYELKIPDDADLSEIVIFPYSENESHGLEDLRLVMFTGDDGSRRYYGTYTAFNGHHIVPQILEITPEATIQITTMSGRYAQNKGMALFPRKLHGRYVMISRLDGENLYIMESTNVRFWNEAAILQKPRFAWELMQIGNCGSPMETDAGWLLLTHGVGPMRQYFIGATLLDRDDPSKLIGQTPEPLLVPVGEEREGYVPNVVYSCGGMVHNDRLIIPYAMSDIASSFATVPLQEVLDLLRG
ncbi:MAG: glycoside hydrolase family 130 protein [Phycisphaerae bacterium]|nr:glycoside hydrolase family 130 protein [Phycisphaerae bacterium]